MPRDPLHLLVWVVVFVVIILLLVWLVGVLTNETAAAFITFALAAVTPLDVK